MSSKPTTRFINGLTVLLTLGLVSTPLMAEDTVESRTSRSISFTQSEPLDKATKDEQLKQAETDVMAPLSKQGFRTESTIKALHTGSTSYGEFSVYDASTELISDLNYDGFYHRFSVAIDVDTIHETSYVYARLYLSLEGGPWNHFATSQDYHIYADSETDTFTIETELADGYPPGYYDVKIDIYDADSGQWVLNYGPYEDGSLANLPLEDSYYDDSYDGGGYPIETEVAVSARVGAASWWLLLLPVVAIAARRFNKV